MLTDPQGQDGCETFTEDLLHNWVLKYMDQIHSTYSPIVVNYSSSGSHIGIRLLWFHALQISFLMVTCCTNIHEEQQEHTFETMNEDGVIVATTSMVPRYKDQLFNFIEEAQLVQDEFNPESLITRAYTFHRGDDGQYYVPDTGAERIGIFGKDGQFIRWIGKQGDGPGEFRSLASISTDPQADNSRGPA